MTIVTKVKNFSANISKVDGASPHQSKVE